MGLICWRRCSTTCTRRRASGRGCSPGGTTSEASATPPRRVQTPTMSHEPCHSSDHIGDKFRVFSDSDGYDVRRSSAAIPPPPPGNARVLTDEERCCASCSTRSMSEGSSTLASLGWPGLPRCRTAKEKKQNQIILLIRTNSRRQASSTRHARLAGPSSGPASAAIPKALSMLPPPGFPGPL